MNKIGKEEITIVISYVADYTNNTADIDDVSISTNNSNEGCIDFPKIIDILELAKSKLIESNSNEEE